MSHPQQLGKYQITELLGEGAMGVVYKAYDPDIRRVVALKTIRRQLDDGSDFAASIAARFRNEAQAAGRLAHPSIVSVYDYGEDARVAYIAMEFVEGQSLAHYANTRVRFTDADIPGVMSQLLDALEHAHKLGVWHRDIKPANVMMSRGGRLKVADFGIARIDGGGLTQATTMIGTPSYMAPEQFLGQAIDHRADIYSAGVLLYLLLTGRPPFVGAPETLMYKAVHEQAQPPSEVQGAGRPGFYDLIVATAMAKDPAQRYASAAAFKDAIVAGLGQPIDDMGWENTIIAAPLPTPRAAAPPLAAFEPSQRSMGSGSHPQLAAAGWDRAVLAQAEASLARYVGPLASVLVRRAARDCADLPALYARLAEQVTNAESRTAFLGHASAAGALAGRSGSGASHPGVSSLGGQASRGGAGPAPAPVSDALAEHAAHLLAHHIGPIAKLVVRKAVARSPHREAFIAALCQAVDDPVKRAQLHADLLRAH